MGLGKDLEIEQRVTARRHQLGVLNWLVPPEALRGDRPSGRKVWTKGVYRLLSGQTVWLPVPSFPRGQRILPASLPPRSPQSPQHPALFSDSTRPLPEHLLCAHRGLSPRLEEARGWREERGRSSSGSRPQSEGHTLGSGTGGAGAWRGSPGVVGPEREAVDP